MSNARRIPLALLAALLLAAAFVGCSDDSPTDTGGGPPVADVNSYLSALPTWEQFSPPLPDLDHAVGDSEVTEVMVGSQPYRCETTPYSLTRTPDKIVTMNPDYEVLWPGSLLQGKGYAEGIGSLAELPIRERAPVQLSIDLLTQNNTRSVDNPTVATVNQAIGDLIQAATDAGHTAGSNVLFTQERMHSVSQGLLKMGLSAKYSGAQINSSLEVSASVERNNVTAYFLQRMFTVSVVLPSTPRAFFSDALTPAKLQEQVDRDRIGPDNLPVFVSNIAYGRLLVFSFSSQATSEEIQATLNIVLESGGEGGGANLTAEQKALLESAEIKVVTVGGDAEHALALIRTGNLSDYFSSDAPLTSARPISYTIRNLADNSIAKVSETTEYSLRECTQQALTATGAEYEITMQQLTYAEWGGLLCGGLCPLITSYDYYTQDTQGQTTVAHYDPAVGAAICQGNAWDLGINNGSPVVPKLRLHLDGRDSVRLFGHISQISPFVNWDRTWRNSIPLGNFSYSRWDGSTGECWRFVISYNVRKVQDLYD